MLVAACLSAMIGSAAAQPAATAATARTTRDEAVAPQIPNAVQFAAPRSIGGILGRRLDLWRRVRLWRVAQDPFLLGGFDHRPGVHPWQGEHVGKWLHAASLDYAATGDARLGEMLRQVAARLIATQQADGYLGTYATGERFIDQRGTGDPKTWDIWTNRYSIQGLLGYCEVVDDPAALDACRRAADLLQEAVGPPDGDLTRFGTRHGLSSAVLLESIVLLHRRTGDPRYLTLARHIVDCIERKPELRITDAMQAGEDVTACGDGKAYQLMAVLLGYMELYRTTGQRGLLDTVVAAWERIAADHVTIAGGPWGYQYMRNTNQECFAPRGYFHPTNCVETCSTTTWIQLSLLLFELTGESRYADAAEVALLNQLLGAQSPDGNRWAYHSMLNMPYRGYDDAITCCASSGPRGLEVYARSLLAVADDRIVIASYLPATVPIDARGRLPASTVVVEGAYPMVPEATVRIEPESEAHFAVDFRLPDGAAGMTITIDGVTQSTVPTEAGFHRIERTWKPGERMVVKFEFPLRAHFQTASDGVRWVGFRWGPLALAQTVSLQTDQPQVVLVVPEESNDGTRWLEPVVAATPPPAVSPDAIEEFDTSRAAPAAAARAAVPSWRLDTLRKVILVPYFLAGAEGGGVRALFPTRTTEP
jgi:DUF1680 family protein